MDAPEPRPHLRAPTFPSTAYLAVSGVVAVTGLGLAFAAIVPSIVGVVSMLPLLVGLQQIGVRKRVERLGRGRGSGNRPGPG